MDCKRAGPRDQQRETHKDESTSMKTKKLFVGGLPQSIYNLTTFLKFRRSQFANIYWVFPTIWKNWRFSDNDR